MAKKALLDVLEQTIGKYVKNLDAESLNVAVWSGKIELHSLDLDTEAVNSELDRRAAEAPNLALPIKVLGGQFENLQVDVPWASLTSRPVVLRAQGLKVNIEPCDRMAQADYLQAVAETEEIRADNVRRAREQSIDLSEKYRQQAYAMRNLAATDEAGASQNSSTFTSRLVRRIIENIQIEIKDVHVCLTDNDGTGGIVLESLSLVTTDKDGKRVFVDRTSQTTSIDNTFLHKALFMEGLGVYLDQESETFFSPQKPSLRPIVESSTDSAPREAPHSYVLAPLSFQANLRQADGTVCVDYAKYQLSSELSSLSILLSRSQLDLARKISRDISASESAACPLFPEYRPLTRIRPGHTKVWWKYAARCIGRLSGRRSWAEFIMAYQKRKQYIPLYKRQAHHATCPWIKPLTPTELAALVTIEQDRTISVEGLIAWRNVADGQADKEREKHQAKQSAKKTTTSSYFTSIFGSTQTSATEQQAEEDEPPIHLTVEELQELENASREEFSDTEVSKDSKLYDANFVLNSLNINLTSYDMRNVAALDMGAVTVDFNAAADGAFGFNFDLADLEIHDRTTPNSLFPSVLRSTETSSPEEKTTAFHLHLSKTKSGDQNLKVKLAAFEAVASRLLLREMKHFFSNSAFAPSPTNRKQNPLLAQSMSGSVDLFYDADQGASLNKPTILPSDPSANNAEATAPTVTSDLSNVLVGAWKEKTAIKAAWTIDVDIKAPVIIIPEQCNDPRASILVFDLGHLRLSYGKVDADKRVLQWFQDHPREDSDLTLDSGTLSVNDLTFKVGRASDWRLLALGTGSESATRENAVIEPISVKLGFGVESASATVESPRVCCIGVVPTISLNLSPSQVHRTLPVLGAWSSFLAELEETSPDEGLLASGLSETSNELPIAPLGTSESIGELASSSSQEITEAHDGVDGVPTFYFLIGLQQLSLTVSLDQRNWLEAHLISVYASASLMSDGSLVSGLRMGWFWILDMLESPSARQQRLLAHSNLPRSPECFAAEDKYDMLKELQTQGVFESEYSGSTELADITFKKVAPTAIRLAKSLGEDYVESILDARFSSLFVHWNPHAVKGVNATLEKFTSIAETYEDTSTIILTPEKTPRSRSVPTPRRKEPAKSHSQMLIKASMESLEIYLNSARDDYPLFVLTVAGTAVRILSSADNLEASLSLGDIRVRTPSEGGSTLAAYRTLLGLAPGRTDSLLTIKYYQGEGSIKRLETPPPVSRKLEAYAEVDLSPMRLCYIHSQVLALVEYATEGILGVITAQAATSAAQAAIDIADSVAGAKLFVIHATAFDVILPQAAYTKEFIAIHAGTLNVDYYMLPGTEGGKVDIDLSDVSLRDTKGELMQEDPIRMAVKVILPSDEVGTIDDQAMRVDVQSSEASFRVSRTQYRQLLGTLDDNIGDVELHLRDQESAQGNELLTADSIMEPDGMAGGLTHAGVEFVETIRRLYLNIRIDVLALQLCGAGFSDPLVRVAAVKAAINMKSLPDKAQTISEVALQNLVCEDCRLRAVGRQYRNLFDQGPSVSEDSRTDGNLFSVKYLSGENDTALDLKIGSPQVVLIPDAIADVLAFVRSDELTLTDHDEAEDLNGTHRASQASVGNNVVDAAKSVDGGTIAVTSAVSVSTRLCRIVLVDLGSQLANSHGQSNSLTETLVLQGKFSAALSSVSELESGKAVESEFQAHGDSMEIFSAFGSAMKSPLQVLEPAKGSAHGSLRTTSEGETEIEIRAAALTIFDFTFSMHNAALLSAIVTSLKESLIGADVAEEGYKIDPSGLSENETVRLENLASALEAGPQSNEMVYRESMSMGDGYSVASTRESATPAAMKVQVKLTMPQTTVTVVNDLQGLDEALFRVSVTNFVAGGEVNQPSSPKATFDCHMNTSILADYFDTSCNLWSKLLVQPWEITLKIMRAPSRRFKSNRLSTTVDLESFPCCVSFSEQFLVSLASAQRMWSIYSVATAVDLGDVSSMSPTSLRASTAGPSGLKASMAASAARNLITSLPYAIENQCGIDAVFSLPGSSVDKCPCATGTTQYCRFEPPSGVGFGGKRTYGQDLKFEKSIHLGMGSSSVDIGHLDYELGLPKRVHYLEDGRVLVTQVVREGKTTVLHLMSHVNVVNNTSVPFNVSVASEKSYHSVGVCLAHNLKRGHDTVLSSLNGVASKESSRFGIPLDLMKPFVKQWVDSGQAKLSLIVSPSLGLAGHPKLVGAIDIVASLRALKKAIGGQLVSKFEVVCHPESNTRRGGNSFVVQVLLKMALTEDDHVSVDVCLEPRAIIENSFPVGIRARTPMPHTFSSSPSEMAPGKDIVYELDPGHYVEVYTPGPSIAVSITTSQPPIAGTNLEWLDGGWIDLPLVAEFRLLEPIKCLLPFKNDHPDIPILSVAAGNEFFIAQGSDSLVELASPDDGKPKSLPSSSAEDTLSTQANDGPLRTFYMTVCNYGVDHSGDILFEQALTMESASRRGSMRDSISGSFTRRSSRLQSGAEPSVPFGAFSSGKHGRRITLLPSGTVPLRILQMTMEGNSGWRRSFPFFAEELAIGQGGVDAAPILWEDKKPSGYYAYRSIANDHQAEIHIIPEFLIFNGSSHLVLLKEPGRPEIIIEAGKVAQLPVDRRPSGLELSLYFIELDCRTNFVRSDKLGLKVALLNSEAGMTVGSVYIQTVLDTRGDARLVVKVGDINKGGASHERDGQQASFFGDDFFRFRVRWTELHLILNETRKEESKKWSLSRAISKMSASPVAGRKEASQRKLQPVPGRSVSQSQGLDTARGRNPVIVEYQQQPVASVIFSRFTFDYQRVFKDSVSPSSRDSLISPERSQISLIVHNVVIKDLSPDSPFPMVFDCSWPNTSFLDLCVRIRGPTNADLIKVDLFDLNLAHANGRSEMMTCTTSEDFVWRILDMANRILAASGEFSGLALKLEEDNVHGGFIVKIEDSNKSLEDGAHYTPPQGDTLYDVNLARVSPFSVLVTFRRNPHSSRYKMVRSNVKGSALMNYFTRRLKFTIERAELNFARYEDRSLKGPPDRLIETLMAVYMSRMKFKLVTLLTSASLQDWKFLAARDSGDDEYVEGDILRATGNLTGKMSHLLLKRVGQTLGDGVSDFSRAVGNTIESTSGKMGARRVGAGVNSVVTGVGDGVGSAVTGVGSGAGKVLKGAGQGLGHAVGGISGGAFHIGKGIGKGLTKGDGRAVVDGFTKGASSVGGGLAQGAESAVSGAADGFFQAGKGLVSGAKSVGLGIGGVFTGKKPKKKK